MYKDRYKIILINRINSITFRFQGNLTHRIQWICRIEFIRSLQSTSFIEYSLCVQGHGLKIGTSSCANKGNQGCYNFNILKHLSLTHQGKQTQ
jgi:hypothetical protein